MLTETQLRLWEKEGGVTVDTPLTTEEIAGASAAMDRLLPQPSNGARAGQTCSYFDAELVALIQHPWFEAVAKQVLCAERVHFYQTAIINAYPEPATPFSFWQHVDIQYRLRDFHATPKNIICSFFLWLTDVNERRAPMMFCPGSHWLLAEYRENDPDWQGDPPSVAPTMLADLPTLPYADPIPLLAKAGQVSVLTTAAVHGASVNVDTELRRNFVLTFIAEGVTIGLPPAGEAQRLVYNRELLSHLRPERRHIIPIEG